MSDGAAKVLTVLLAVREGAKVLGLPVNRVYEMTARGELPSVRLGRSVRIPADALQRWIEERTTGGKSEAA